jgi:NAD-dependent protein deacetylase/lipoamidase
MLTFDPNPERLLRVAEAVRRARNIMVITGAGISAESGIPTFRGPGGWWKSRNPEELATLKAFVRDPGLVWEWYEYRRELVAKAKPNAAHRVLASLEMLGKEVFILTQNVDDLHERAGSSEIVHIHGSIWHLTCMKDGKTTEDRRVPLPSLPPTCVCGGIQRPAVVWFDENLPTAECDRVEKYLEGQQIDVVFTIGTYVTFPYIENWALRAQATGALLAEINTEETRLTSRVDVVLRGKAGEMLSALEDQLPTSCSPAPDKHL